MANAFVWFELVTPDAEAAKAFYTTVVGWGTEASSGPAGPYTIFKAGEIPVGGMLQMQDMPPGWLGYVGVDDVDAYAKKVEAAGGAIHKAPQDIPDVGRFAVVADPQGAMFVLFKGSRDETPPRPAPMSPGSLCWTELHATDGQAAFDFYSDLFGWTKGDAMPMGGTEGLYQLFGGPEGPIGGMFSHQTQAPGPYWLYYFGVEGVDSAIERVKAGGGKILLEPMAVPGGFVVNAMDPQGGFFAVLGPRG